MGENWVETAIYVECYCIDEQVNFLGRHSRDLLVFRGLKVSDNKRNGVKLKRRRGGTQSFRQTIIVKHGYITCKPDDNRANYKRKMLRWQLNSSRSCLNKLNHWKWFLPMGYLRYVYKQQVSCYQLTSLPENFQIFNAVYARATQHKNNISPPSHLECLASITWHYHSSRILAVSPSA